MGDGAGEIHPAPAGRLNRPIRRSAPEVRNESNYRISDSDRIGEGPPRQKLRQNIEAIQTLRKVEAEGRPATPEEKTALVRYVGWGAMPQVFDPRNYEWRSARAEVEPLVQLVAPFAPHIAEEMWQMLGHTAWWQVLILVLVVMAIGWSLARAGRIEEFLRQDSAETSPPYRSRSTSRAGGRGTFLAASPRKRPVR